MPDHNQSSLRPVARNDDLSLIRFEPVKYENPARQKLNWPSPPRSLVDRHERVECGFAKIAGIVETTIAIQAVDRFHLLVV